MLITEKDIETNFKFRVEHLGGKCIKFYSASETGLPDRIAILPGGKVIFVELKRPSGGKIAPIQKYQMDKLQKLGCDVRVIKSFTDIDKFVEDYGGSK